MSAEEKRINVTIDGDASGLNDEIERVGKRAAKAFKELGFDAVFEEAANKFEKRIEQFEHVLRELNSERQEVEHDYHEKMKHVTNQSGVTRVETERNQRLERLNRAAEALQKAMQEHNKRFERGTVDERGNPTGGKPKPEEEERVNPAALEGEKNSRWDGMGKQLGKSFAQILQGNFGTAFRGLFNGGSGGGAQAAEGEAAGGGGFGAGMLRGGIWAAVGALAIHAWKQGAEDLRADNRLRAMGAGRDSMHGDYDYGEFSSMGISRIEAKKMMLGNMQSVVGLGANSTNDTPHNDQDIKKQYFDYTLQRQRFESAYGIDAGTQQRLDPFYRQNSQNGNQIIAEMMVRNRGEISASNGTILGNLATEKLNQIVRLMEYQKEHGQRTDSRLAMDVLKAGSKIGGQFADDRGGEKMLGIVNNLSTSNNEVVKSMVFSMLLKKYGNISDALAAREGLGGNSEDLRFVMGGMGKAFGGGEMAKLMLGSSGLGLGSQTDINRFVNGNGFATTSSTIAEGQRQAETLTEKANQVFDELKKRAENLTLNTDALQVKANNVSIIAGRAANTVVGNEAGVITENKVK